MILTLLTALAPLTKLKNVEISGRNLTKVSNKDLPLADLWVDRVQPGGSE